METRNWREAELETLKIVGFEFDNEEYAIECYNDHMRLLNEYVHATSVEVERIGNKVLLKANNILEFGRVFDKI